MLCCGVEQSREESSRRDRKRFFFFSSMLQININIKKKRSSGIVRGRRKKCNCSAKSGGGGGRENVGRGKEKNVVQENQAEETYGVRFDVSHDENIVASEENVGSSYGRRSSQSLESGRDGRS